MKRIFIVLTVIFVIFGVSQAKGYKLSGQTGDYNITMMFDKDKPSIGKNQIQIEVTDSTHRLMRNGLIQIDYFMPSLPGRPPMMVYKTNARPAGGIYIATLDLAMKGLWRITLTMRVEEKSEKLTLEFEVK